MPRGGMMELDNLQHDPEDFEVWLEYGMISGFCGPIICADHDGIPMTIVEEEAVEEYGEACIPIIRIYQDKATAKAIVANHGPTYWRDGMRFL